MYNKSFDSKRIALGYAKRSWLHKSVIEQLKTDCNLEENFRFKNGLDGYIAIEDRYDSQRKSFRIFW